MSQMDGDAALCRQWLADEQRVHERAECAPSSAAVSDALREQTRRVKLVRDYETKVNRAKADAKDDGSRQELSSAYTELVSVAQHQKTCIEARVKVASLEQAFSTLSTEFSQRAAQLVQRTCQPDTDYQQTGGVGLGRAAQGCVLAMKDSWDWLQELHRCSQLQLQHAATYHQFYHSAREYACWMPDELQRSLDALRDTAARADDVHKLVLVLKETVTRFAHWQTKMAALLEASGHVVPVHLRTAPLQHYRPITALAAYKSSQIKVHAGEELTLLDNSDAAQWRVRNTHCDEARLPSVICLIPGLDPDAVALVTRLRIKLLSMWTLCIRASGNALIQYFLYVFKDWDDNQKQKLVSLLDDDKLSMRAVMRSVEEVLGKYWSGQAAWGTLVGRLRATGTLLLQQGNAKDHDKQFSREYKGHISNIEEILLHFMSCLRQWDTYRLLVETSRHSDHVLLVDSWRHLKFFNTAQVLEESEMSLFDGDAVDARLLDQSDSFTAATVDHVTKATPTDVLVTEEGQSQFGSSEIGVEKTIELKTGAMIEQTEETETTETTVSTEVTQETEVTEVAETEELHHAEGEESRTFVITGVVDPSTGEEVSMQQAVLLGILDNTRGLYVDRRRPGGAIPIPEAMNQGLIKVEFTRTKRQAEKRSDIGLMTVRTQRESRPYTVVGVVDAGNGREMSVDEAVRAGILDQSRGVYRNAKTGADMSLGDALDSDLLIVDYEGESSDFGDSTQEVVTRTYAIHAVVDQRTKERVNFAQAVRLGLLDRETGAYFHSGRGEHIWVGDAIKRGFVKATVVDDPNDITDIAPENKMVVEKVNLIRKKLLNPLKFLAAFNMVASASKGGSDGEAGSEVSQSTTVTSSQETSINSPGSSTSE